MAIKPELYNKVFTYIDSIVDKAKIRIDGVEQTLNIFRTVVTGQTIRHYVYLETQIGKVEYAVLIDSTGRELQDQIPSVQKYEDGLMVVFQINLKAEGV